MSTATNLQHIALTDTVSFVRSAVASGASLLDAGCGDGTVAAALQQAGYLVTAIDRNPESIANARSAGVNAEPSDFLDYASDERFDVVFLARSLHHMHPIERAVSKIVELLKPDGLVLLEEFGVELMDTKSALWFYGVKSVLEADDPEGHPKQLCQAHHPGGTGDHAHGGSDGHGGRSHGPGLEHGAIPHDLVGSWNEHHLGKHDVIASSSMLKALAEAKLEVLQQSYVPYLYRYFVDSVSAEKLDAIFRWEARLCGLGLVTPIGLRVVARLQR